MLLSVWLLSRTNQCLKTDYYTSILSLQKLVKTTAISRRGALCIVTGIINLLQTRRLLLMGSVDCGHDMFTLHREESLCERRSRKVRHVTNSHIWKLQDECGLQLACSRNIAVTACSRSRNPLITAYSKASPCDHSVRRQSLLDWTIVSATSWIGKFTLCRRLSAHNCVYCARNMCITA
jgi:hypothetical protein